jgi:hypothetical protein
MENKETVTYYVNSEKQTTSQDKLEVKTILENAGFKPPNEYELERDEGHHIYKDQNEEVPLHNDERFTALSVGPTPTS